MLSVSYAECHIQALYEECHYAECSYDEGHYAECNYDECHYAECSYAVFLDAEYLGAKILAKT
jgi:hypothetical protein